MNNELIKLIKNKTLYFPKDNIGLFTGKIGCSFALFIINRNIKDYELRVIAETLLKETIDSVFLSEDLSIDKGLTGIGLAINYLISKGYIYSDLNEVLSDIDAFLYKNLKDENIKYGISCTSGLTAYLIYLVERISNSTCCDTLNYQINVASLRTIINKLGIALPTLFIGITKDMYTSLIYDYPILFIYLKKAFDLNIYSEKINNIIKSWATFLISYIPYYNTNKLYLATALAYLNATISNSVLEQYIQLLIYSLNMEDLYKEIDPKILNINEGFFFVDILLQAAEKLFTNSDFGNECHILHLKINKKFIPIYQKYLQTIVVKDFNLNLINGVLGIETINTLYPSLFKLNK